MCVIVYKPKGVAFSDEDFRLCWKRNSHGLGFISLNPFALAKGFMDEKKALKKTKEARHQSAEAVFHFRIQSKGGIDKSLTHPFAFPSEDERKRFLFHNGTIHTLNPDNKDSDSSFAAQILQNLNDSDVDNLLKMWNTTNRFITVIETEKGSGKYTIKKYGDAESVESKGLWFSNLRHLATNVACNKHTKGDSLILHGGGYYGADEDWEQFNIPRQTRGADLRNYIGFD